MIKLCKTCHEKRNGYAINPLYPICVYGYNILVSTTRKDQQCPYDDCKYYENGSDYSLVDVDITEEDFKTIMCVSNDCAFIDAMINLKQTEPIEYGMKMAQIRPAAEQAQKAIDAAWNKKVEEANAPIPKCPTCGSTNLKKISTTSKAVNTAIWGLLGTKRHKTYHCNDCGYEW